MGILTDPLDRTRTALGLCAAWVTWTGAANAAAAEAFVHNYQAGAPDEDPLPRCVIWDAAQSRDHFVDDVFSRATGTIRLQFEAEASSGLTAASARAARATFDSNLESVLAQLENYTGDEFEVRGVRISQQAEASAEEEFKDATTRFDYLQRIVEIDWSSV